MTEPVNISLCFRSINDGVKMTLECSVVVTAFQGCRTLTYSLSATAVSSHYISVVLSHMTSISSYLIAVLFSKFQRVCDLYINEKRRSNYTVHLPTKEKNMLFISFFLQWISMFVKTKSNDCLKSYSKYCNTNNSRNIDIEM